MQWFEDADAQVVAVCDAAVERLEGMGAKVVDICIPELEACRVAHVRQPRTLHCAALNADD